MIDIIVILCDIVNIDIDVSYNLVMLIGLHLYEISNYFSFILFSIGLFKFIFEWFEIAQIIFL